MTTIDLRSDTLTRPTAAMREAIATAVVGDEQKGEDPTVTALEERLAALLGLDAALFVPSATMANQIALRVHGEAGDELLAEASSHVFLYELGGAAVHAGLVMKPIVGASGGMFGPAEIDATYAPPAWYHSASKIVSFENTHVESGGRVWPQERLRATVDHARERGLRVHLDGARLFNAAVALGVEPREIAAQFDTVTICLSKGLGCPVGAVVAGRTEPMAGARRWKQLFGGAMRQAGILAAAGLHALDHHVERLAVDHEHARRFGAALADAGLTLEATPETNMVLIDVRPLGLDSATAQTRLEEQGVRLSALARPGILRAVTHLDVSEQEIDAAAERACAALAPQAMAAHQTGADAA
jgi:threonine aldolase